MLTPIVLLVDDHEDSREMYAAWLNVSGFKVCPASDGAEALAQAAVSPPSIVLTDLRMPGPVSAADLCRHFTALGVPIIVMTAVGAGPEQEAVQSAGCTTVLMKPFALSALIADMNRMLEVRAESNRVTPRRESTQGSKAGTPGFPAIREPDPRIRRKRPS